MNRKLLEKFELSEDQVNQIMDENGKDIEKLKKSVEEKQGEVDGLQSRLDEVQQKLAKFDGIDVTKLNEEIASLQSSMKEKDEAHKTEIAQKDYGYAVEAAVSALKFSSVGAKKAFAADLKEKGLKIENGSLLGFSDYVDEYKKTDPGAFAEDKEPTPPYAAGTGTNKELDAKNITSMGYLERVKLKNENPTLYETLTNKE